AACTVTVDTTSRTLGTLDIGDSVSPFFAYTLTNSAGVGLIFNNSGSAAKLTQAATTAADVITVPITLLDNLSVSNSSSLTLSEVINGAKSITKVGAGTLTLSGTNTFSGGIIVNDGKLGISSDANLGAASGSLTFSNSGTLVASQSIVSTRALNMAGDGFFDIGNGMTLEERGAISGNGSIWAINSGIVILSGSGSNGTGITAIKGGLSIRGTVALGSGVVAFKSGVLELGNSDFTRPPGTGAGQVNFTILGVGWGGFAAFGADRIVNLGGSGATLTWGTNSFIPSGQILVLGNYTADHMVDFQNGLNLNGNTESIVTILGVGTGPEGKISGIVSGTGNSNLKVDSFNGVGPLFSNGSNSYAGKTIIGGGNLLLSASATGTAGNTVLGSGSSDILIGDTNSVYNAGVNPAGLLTAGPVTIARHLRVLPGNNGVISIGGYTADSSTFAGNIYLGTNGVTTGQAVTLTAVSGGTVTFSGVIQDATGVTTGFGAVTKNGVGTISLTGTNTYIGATTVSNGTLAINGSVGTNLVKVATGAKLAGAGVIKGPVTILSGGTLQPGTNSSHTASLTVSNTLTLAGATILSLNRTNAQNSSRVQGISTVTYGGTLTLTNVGPALLANETFTLFTATSYSGTFSATNLPALTAGLVWNTTQLSVNGSVVINKSSQTITFSSPGNQTYGVAPLTLGATASSGLAVTYSVTSGPATVSGNTLTITGAGSVTIQAAQVGDANWNAATPVSQVITIAQKTVTGSVTASSKVYDGTTTATIASRNLTGVVGADVVSLTGGSATFANKTVGNGKTVSAVGLSLTGAQAANYTLASSSASTTANITASTVTVSGVTAANKIYNGNATAIVSTNGAALVGVIGGDTVALTGSASGTFANSTVGIGKIVTVSGLSLSGADAANYVLSSPTPTANITAASTLLGVTSSLNPALPGSNIIFTATVSVVAPGAGTPTGNVIFKDGATALSTNALNGSAIATFSTSTLSHGNHTITAAYADTGNFSGSTNSLGQLVDAPPVATNDTVPRYANSGVKVRATTLLANDSDPDGDTLTLVSVNPASGAGGTIVMQNGWVIYAPPVGFTNADTFSYVIADGLGLQATGVVSIAIATNLAPAENIGLIEDLGNNTAHVQFFGIPARFYTIQYATNLVTPNWQPVATNQTGATGALEFTNTPPNGSPPRFYRSVYP
ncbi:MAG: YDG domain-containing protein, partial [Verrucomicrobiota bacterium]